MQGDVIKSTIAIYGSPSSIANVTTSKNKTVSHSNEPLCWSGSQPDIASIQSGQKGVTTYRRPVIPPTVTCAQKRRGIFLIEAFNSGCSRLRKKGGPSSDAKKPRAGEAARGDVHVLSSGARRRHDIWADGTTTQFVPTPFSESKAARWSCFQHSLDGYAYPACVQSKQKRSYSFEYNQFRAFSCA